MCNAPADRRVCKKSILFSGQNEVASETGMKLKYFTLSFPFSFFFFSFSEMGITLYTPWAECPMVSWNKKETCRGTRQRKYFCCSEMFIRKKVSLAEFHMGEIAYNLPHKNISVTRNALSLENVLILGHTDEMKKESKGLHQTISEVLTKMFVRK